MKENYHPGLKAHVLTDLRVVQSAQGVGPVHTLHVAMPARYPPIHHPGANHWRIEFSSHFTSARENGVRQAA